MKAEVILDTLLTLYIAGLVKNGLDELKDFDVCLVAKEMSIPIKKSEKGGLPVTNNGKKDARGPKIDYVLAWGCRTND